jgi:hypothetical protein
MCKYCIAEKDYIEHFFFNCTKIKHLWKHVADVFWMKWNKRIDLKANDVLVGIADKNMFCLSYSEWKCINHLLLIGKMCISKFKYGTPIDITFMFDRELLIRKKVFLN